MLFFLALIDSRDAAHAVAISTAQTKPLTTTAWVYDRSTLDRSR